MTRYVVHYRRYRASQHNGHMRLVRHPQAHKPRLVRAYSHLLYLDEPPLKPTPVWHIAAAIVWIALIIAIAWIANRGGP